MNKSNSGDRVPSVCLQRLVCDDTCLVNHRKYYFLIVIPFVFNVSFREMILANLALHGRNVIKCILSTIDDVTFSLKGKHRATHMACIGQCQYGADSQLMLAELMNAW